MRLLLFTSICLFTACSLLGGGDNNYNPEIVFSADDGNGTSQIYTMNEDGSNVTKLTNFGTDNIGIEPAWSPDGEQIVFSTTLQSSSNGLSLYIMEADGSNMRPMHERENSHIPTPGNHAKWSPDGSKIIFQSCVACQVGTNIELFIYDFVTDSVIQLTDTDYSITNTNPVWRPDGSRIAFVSDRDHPEEGGSDIYMLEIGEGIITRVTQTGNAGRQLWTPNGQELIYWSENNLHKIELSTLESEMISFGLDGNTGFRPFSLSPDGQKVLLHVFSYTSTVKEQSLQQLDLSSGAVTTIYSGKGINGVDWISQQNK